MQGRGALKTLNDPDAGKRDRSASGKIVRGLRLEAYVQAPNGGFPLGFEAKELAIIAIFSTVDPYLICGQHLLLAKDIIAVREVGDWLLGRSGNPPELVDLIHRLKGAKLAVSASSAELTAQLIGIRDAYATAEALLLLD